MKRVLAISFLLVLGLISTGSCGGTVLSQSSVDGGHEGSGPTCGAVGAACCEGTACNAGLVCSGGTCTPVGMRDAGVDSAPDVVVADARIDSAADVVLVDAGKDSPSTKEAGDSGGPPPSCAPGGPGRTNCGPGGSGTSSCCTGLAVTGGTFYRSYDAVTYTDSSHPATISGFRLDQYEITVGRFRQFVGAMESGWSPPAGSGKHTHLNGGKGLVATGGGYEAGWDSAWTSTLATTAGGWDIALGGTCGGIYATTWTSAPGTNENQPMTCETWYEAYAFCIWDGGFLPSEAEWNYAAAGGGASGGQRAYPWASPPIDTTIDCLHAAYSGCTVPTASTPGTINVGVHSPAGDGAFGQADLAGNVWGWTLDSYDVYSNPCINCANVSAASARVLRGGSFYDTASALLSSNRNNASTGYRSSNLGARCARAP